MNSDERPEGMKVQFHLIYQGPLKSDSGQGGTAKQKHDIRRCFHQQLRELWSVHPYLRGMNARRARQPALPSFVDRIAHENAKFGYQFVPLVSEQGGTSCSLDILFLRRDGPGSLVASGGDIDNRIKILLDSMRMPNVASEVANAQPLSGESPFFCLMSDDKLITGINVRTDRLLLERPAGAGPRPGADVTLVIGVTVEIEEPGLSLAYEVQRNLDEEHPLDAAEDEI